MGSALAQVSVLVGTGMPLLIAVFQKAHFSRTVRTVIGAMASLAAAALTAYLQHKLNWHTWAVSAIYVYGATLVTYRNIWVPLGAAPWIEDNINGSKHASKRGVHHG